ncbi:tyrosyl-tRNA synthetase [Xylographa soralifera]|nr:tyrosyl-tRNA synthetase [Xylographa soralifera]
MSQEENRLIRQRQAWLRKTAEAEEAWKLQAHEIQSGRKESMLTVLEKRGYVNSTAGERDDLDQLMIQKRVGAYVGIDPTAPSLHVGHLLPLMSLFWMYVSGFHAVTLLGGATAQVGDPTGRTTTRETTHSTVRKANMVNMHYQLKMLWANMEHHARFKHGYQWEWAWHRGLVNNNTWMNKLPLVEVLKVLGSGTRIGTMLGRDTVKNKMKSGDGISFSEFTYPLLQAWDWWHMYNTNNIQVQIGGSDQFGNIIAGIDAINYIRKSHYDPNIRQEKDDPLRKPMGFTVPLLTTASGEKFGKSAGNAVWLDKDMTSTFELYQFFVRSADSDVARYLRLFTFIPLPEIDKIMTDQEQEPSKRIAQRRLAREVVEMIYGTKEAEEVETQHITLFRPVSTPKPIPIDDPKAPSLNVSLNPNAPHISSQNAPASNMVLPHSLVHNQPIARVLFAAGLVASRSEGHRLASNRGAYVGGLRGAKPGMTDGLSFTPITNWKPEDTSKYIIDNSLIILRVGKWKVKVVKIIPDDQFDAQGLEAPGWKEWKGGQTLFVDEEKEKHLETVQAENRKISRRANAEQWKLKKQLEHKASVASSRAGNNAQGVYTGAISGAEER